MGWKLGVLNMAGLLDALNTDEARLGLGLLAAGGYSPTPMSFGQRIQSAMQGQDAQKRGALQNKLLQSQVDENDSQVAARKAAALKAAGLQDMIKNLFPQGMNAPAVSSGAFTPSADGMGPTMPPSMAALGRPGSAIGNLSIDQIAGLEMAGGPKLLDHYKWVKDPLKLEQGSTYEDRASGSQRYIPKIGEGMAPNRNGVYGPVPGYAEGVGAIEGAKTTAVEKAKAGFDLVPVRMPDGATDYKPRAEVLSPQPTQQLAAPQSPQLRPMAPRPGESDRFAILSQELQRAQASGNAADVASIQREIGRLPASEKTGASPAGLAVPRFQATPTTAQAVKEATDKEYQLNATKDIGETRKTIMNAGFAAPSTIAKYQQLGKLLQDVDGGTLTATGTNIASTMNSLGFKIDKNLSNKEAAAALGNEMALELRNPANGAGMPGAMSDADRNYLVSMIPNASQSADGRKQLLEAKIAVEQRKVQTANFARNYEKKHGRLDNDFFEQMTVWSAQNPLFKGK